MSEQIHFRYENIGNIIHLLINITFEKNYPMKDITVYHQRFDAEKDSFFEEKLKQLFPAGCNVGEKELQTLTEYIYNFMQTDSICRDEYVKWNKQHMYSWVYFKPDNEVIYAANGDHAHIIKEKCMEFFRHFDTIDVDYLRKFILENFEIRSDCSTIERISNDAPYIAEMIKLNHYFS